MIGAREWRAGEDINVAYTPKVARTGIDLGNDSHMI